METHLEQGIRLYLEVHNSSSHLIVLRCRNKFSDYLLHRVSDDGTQTKHQIKPGCSVEIRFQMASLNLNVFVWRVYGVWWVPTFSSYIQQYSRYDIPLCSILLEFCLSFYNVNNFESYKVNLQTYNSTPDMMYHSVPY
jgi:hypothetical protein